MAELHYNEDTGEWAFRQKLRSPYIDYCHGCFFVTFQVIHNKSALGVIVGEECILNELGEAIRAAWLTEEQHVKGLKIFDFQVMPNHFHALLRYDAEESEAAPAGNGERLGGPSGPPATQTSQAATLRSYWATAPCSSWATEPRSRATAPSSCRATAPCSSWATAPRSQATVPGRATAPGRPPARYTRDPKAHDLPYVIGLFKSWTTKLYHRLKAEGRCLDLGPKLWQASFYDELIRSDVQFTNTAAYIRNNPRNWSLDRFGAVTSYSEGNLDLLQSEYVAYLSSEGYLEGTKPGEIPMRCITGKTEPTAPCSCRATVPGSGATAPCSGQATAPGRSPVISTFTSYYERLLLEKCLCTGRRFIWICPGGINPAALQKARPALDKGQALLLSPVAPNTGVNKQRANWCNQFIAKNAKSIWIGHIRAGGSLESILKGCKKCP